MIPVYNIKNRYIVYIYISYIYIYKLYIYISYIYITIKSISKGLSLDPLFSKRVLFFEIKRCEVTTALPPRNEIKDGAGRWLCGQVATCARSPWGRLMEDE